MIRFQIRGRPVIIHGPNRWFWLCLAGIAVLCVLDHTVRPMLVYLGMVVGLSAIVAIGIAIRIRYAERTQLPWRHQ